MARLSRRHKVMGIRMSLNKYRIEIGVTVIGICIAVGASVFFLFDLLTDLVAQPALDYVVLAGIALALLYTNVAYLLSRIGNLKRDLKHFAQHSQDFLPFYDKD